jgi:hypothetical protein
MMTPRPSLTVPHPPKVVFLESREGVQSLFTRGLRSGAQAAGWKTETVFLADASGRERSENDVRREIVGERPDTVSFLMDAPLSLRHLWESPALAGVDKVSLWFDDYHRSPRTLAQPGTWTEWQHGHGVRVGIWDGYWRRQWERLTQAEAFPIHLAANPADFSWSAAPWRTGWSHRATFIGTIPSRHSLDQAASALPSPLSRFLADLVRVLEKSPWPIRAYDTAASIKLSLGARHRAAIDALLDEPRLLAFWNHLVWRWGKRISRLRGLAAVAEAGPLAILSGHGTEHYADEADLRTALPRHASWVYADTRALPPSNWSSLFRTGKFQVQITDPQSIEGGLPFRVFECGACAVPLLSDHRPELKDLFPASSGLTVGRDETELRDAASELFATSDSLLAEQGRRLHRHFLKGHTWEIRWRQIMGPGISRFQASEMAPRTLLATAA